MHWSHCSLPGSAWNLPASHLTTRAHAWVGCDRAGAARCLLGAARRREVARGRRCAVGGAGEAGGGGVRALCARQRCRRTCSAVGAGRASNACLLARGGLVLAGFTLGTGAHAGVGSNSAGAARCLHGAARRSVEAWVSGLALGGAAEVGGTRVRPPATWQRRPRPLRTEGAGLARSRTRCGSRRALVRARGASGASHTAFTASIGPCGAVETRGGCGTSRHLMTGEG